MASEGCPAKLEKRSLGTFRELRLASQPNPTNGAIAQLGERLLCKQEVVGSIPSGSTSRDLENSSEENVIRVRSHYGLARAKGSRELRAARDI